MWQYAGMTVHQCPRCELRFLNKNELQWHLDHDHPAPQVAEPERSDASDAPVSRRPEIFSDAEWQTLAFATLQAYAHVATTDLKVDEKEEAAFMKMLEAPNRGPLVAELTHSMRDRMTETLLAFDKDPRSGDQRIRELASLLEDKTKAGLLTQEEAGLVKSFLLDLAFAVAEASRPRFKILESKVSDDEAKAILLVADLIDYNDEDPEVAQAVSNLRSRLSGLNPS